LEPTQLARALFKDTPSSRVSSATTTWEAPQCSASLRVGPVRQPRTTSAEDAPCMATEGARRGELELGARLEHMGSSVSPRCPAERECRHLPDALCPRPAKDRTTCSSFGSGKLHKRTLSEVGADFSDLHWSLRRRLQRRPWRVPRAKEGLSSFFSPGAAPAHVNVCFSISCSQRQCRRSSGVRASMKPGGLNSRLWVSDGLADHCRQILPCGVRTAASLSSSWYSPRVFLMGFSITYVLTTFSLGILGAVRRN